MDGEAGALDTLRPGGRLGARYRLERRLGQGGMGQVWLARDERLGRDVAIKTLHSGVSDFTDALRLRKEARAIAALGHRGIVQVHDIETTENGVLFVVMEHIDGRSLRQRLISEGPLPVDDVVTIVREAAAALQVAHDAGLIHRDIKPDNLMQRADGSVVVLDFGLAKALPARPIDALSPTEQDLTRTGAMVGTPAYLSPEQARGGSVGPAADQWSLAVTAWELLTGELPWGGDSIAELLVSILEQELPPIGERRQDVPTEFAEQLARALQRDARERLDRIDSLGSVCSPGPGMEKRPDFITRRTAMLLTFAASALLIALFGRIPDELLGRAVVDPLEANELREGRLEILSTSERTTLEAGWSVEASDGVFVPFDPRRSLAEQGVEPRARMRYRIGLDLGAEAAAHGRRTGLSLLRFPSYQRVSVRAGRGESIRCETDYFYTPCSASELEHGLTDEGQLDLEVTVEVPRWSLWQTPEGAHLHPQRAQGREALSLSSTPAARNTQNSEATRSGAGEGQVGWLLLFVFAVIGFARRELRHYLTIAAFLGAVSLIGAFHSPVYAWLFPQDPWACFWIDHLQYPVYGVVWLEMVHRVVGSPPGRRVRLLQLALLGLGLAAVVNPWGLGNALLFGSPLLATMWLTVFLIRSYRNGRYNSGPLLWSVLFGALCAASLVLYSLGIAPGFITARAVGLAQVMAFCFILARDLFGARASLEQANRNLEQRVSERTVALERANEKLSELDKAKTRFFENVSHELRTPLTLVLGPATKLLEDDELPPERRRPIELIVRQSRRLLRMVNRMLDVQRLDAGRMHLDVGRTDLTSLARRVVDAFSPAAEDKGLALSVDAEHAVMADVDPERFEDVLFNLLSNAIKHSSSGARIRVRVFEDGSSRHPVHVEVRDTGEGIPKAQLPHVFERFRRVEGRSASGTGIGLALVKELVSLHRGKVEVESEEGFGATFSISLPAARLVDFGDVPETDPERVALELAALAAGPRPLERRDANADAPVILVADDHPDLREYVRSCLEPELRVVEACDGEEALAILESGERIDAVVSDVMMPRMDGYELLDRIRTSPELCALPVILLTAKSGGEMRVEGLDAGADDYLGKPFDPAELRARLRNALRVRAAPPRLRSLG